MITVHYYWQGTIFRQRLRIWKQNFSIACQIFWHWFEGRLLKVFQRELIGIIIILLFVWREGWNLCLALFFLVRLNKGLYLWLCYCIWSYGYFLRLLGIVLRGCLYCYYNRYFLTIIFEGNFIISLIVLLLENFCVIVIVM